MRGLILSLLLCCGISSFAQNSWSLYRGNSQLTGVSNESILSGIDIQWSFKTESPIKASPVVSNGLIIIGSTDGKIYCLNLNGELQWKFETGNAIESPALIIDSRVYIGNLTGEVFCLELKSGKQVWKYVTEGQVMGSPNVYTYNEEKNILIGSYDFYMHSINASTGKLNYKYELDYYLNGTVALNNNKAVFGGCDGLLHIVDVASGNALKKIELGTYIAGSAAIYNNVAYFGDYEGKFYAADILEQKISWTWKNPSSDMPFIASPSAHNNKVYVGNRDKNVYCFSATSGEMIWKKNTGGQVDASTIVCKNGLLVCNMRGDIQYLSLSEGKLLWAYELGSGIASNPAIYNGGIIVGAVDGNVYMLK